MTPSLSDAHSIRFPHWKEALARCGLSPAEQDAYRHAIFAFLRFCREQHAPASVASIRRYHAMQQPGLGVRSPLDGFGPV